MKHFEKFKSMLKCCLTHLEEDYISGAYRGQGMAVSNHCNKEAVAAQCDVDSNRPAPPNKALQFQ